MYKTIYKKSCVGFVGLLRNEHGASALEYAIIAALIAAALIGFLEPVRDALGGVFGAIAAALDIGG